MKDTNCVSVRGAEGFGKGTAEGCSFRDGFLRLDPGRSEGSFTSEWFDCEGLSRLVLWWNGLTSGDSFLVPRARIRAGGRISGWMRWGEWRSRAGGKSFEEGDDLCEVDTDTLTMKEGAGTADAVQLGIVLSGDGAVSPLCFGLGCTWRGAELPAVPEQELRALPERISIDAPLYSQMIREPDMAHVMCSAVTAAVLLNRHGAGLLPEQVALTDYDVRYEGYGNWSFTMAAASAFGFETSILYAGLDRVKLELAAGRPVGMNVYYSASPDGKYPYLLNGAIDQTGGHLLTLTGCFEKDGAEWFISHDSAAVGDENCLRFYRADQLAECSCSILYLLGGRYPFTEPFPERSRACEAEIREDGTALLSAEGKAILLPADLYDKRLTDPAGGLLAIAEGEIPGMSEGCVPTEANRRFRYDARVAEDGSVRLPEDVLRGIDRGVRYTLYAVRSDGTVLSSELKR